jgi:hypothetical protein
MTVLSSLQTIHRAITGITKAPDGSATYPMPSQINAADLPCVLLFPSDIDITAAARNEIEATQSFNGLVLVTSQAAGVGVDTSINAVWTVLDAFHERYKTLIGTTELLTGGVVVTSYHDERPKPQRITYRGADWLGWEFNVVVWLPV